MDNLLKTIDLVLDGRIVPEVPVAIALSLLRHPRPVRSGSRYSQHTSR